MPKFWLNPWLQLNNIGYPSIVKLWLLHGENFMAIFTTPSVVIWFSTGTLEIFAKLVYVVTMRVVIYDILSMAINPTLLTSILFCNLCYILLWFSSRSDIANFVTLHSTHNKKLIHCVAIFTTLYGNYYPTYGELKLICIGKFSRRTWVNFTQQYGKNRQRCQRNIFYITPCVKCGFTHALRAEIRIFTPRDIKFRTILVRKTFSWRVWLHHPPSARAVNSHSTEKVLSHSYRNVLLLCCIIAIFL